MIQRPAIGISVTLFVLSLFFPVFEFEEADAVMGHQVLLWGWWGVILFNAGWVANLAWAISIFQMFKNRVKPAFYWSLGAALLSLEGFAVTEWWFNEGSGTQVTGLGPGFFCWLSSIVLLFLVNTMEFVKLKNKKTPVP